LYTCYKTLFYFDFFNHQQVVIGFDDHEEVCRTVSDTLAAEYIDYVTIKRSTPLNVHQDSNCSLKCNSKEKSLQSCDEITIDCNYNSKVEFGLKLGYTESQVQMALVKIGPTATQNELLEELIKLGASESIVKPSKGSNLASPNCSSGVESDESDNDNLVSIKNKCDKVEECENLRPIVIDGSNVAMRSVLNTLLHIIFNINFIFYKIIFESL